MKFDPYAALEELRAEAGGGATRATRATQTPETPPRVAQVARVARGAGREAEIEPAASPVAPAPSRQDAEHFPHGISAGGRPLTWTGRVVSLDEWRRA